MSKVSITRSLLDDLAVSISTKSGEPVPMTLTEMKDAVDSIQTGGDITVESLSVISNGTYTAPTGKAYTPVTVSVPTPTPTLQTKTKTYTPTETAQSETVTADSGYDGLSSVEISVGAISNTYVGTGITRRSSSDLTASGATVTVPSGYYSAQSSKAVSSGTAGTPTASKGTVSNHSVSVTPSVTNTTGYITGGTKTGAAVTVSASELVSGSETKTSNGTYDVTNLAELVVNVSSSTPAISVVDTTDSAGGTIRTITALDISDTTAVASDVASGKYFYTADGTKTAGTGSGGSPSATQHTIYFEFTDSTDATINAWYDSSFISDAITATEPTTYGQKTVDVAELDGVEWYHRPTETWETVLNGNLHVNTGNPYGGIWASDLGSVSIALGSVWRVTIDNGTPYTVTATANGIYGSPNQNIIGNPLFMGGTDDGSDVPFAFEQNPWGAWTGGTDTSITQDVDHHFKIERQISA